MDKITFTFNHEKGTCKMEFYDKERQRGVIVDNDGTEEQFELAILHCLQNYAHSQLPKAIMKFTLGNVSIPLSQLTQVLNYSLLQKEFPEDSFDKVWYDYAEETETEINKKDRYPEVTALERNKQSTWDEDLEKFEKDYLRLYENISLNDNISEAKKEPAATPNENCDCGHCCCEDESQNEDMIEEAIKSLENLSESILILTDKIDYLNKLLM